MTSDMHQNWIERASELRNTLRQASPRGESERRLPGDIVDALDAAGLFRLSVPENLAGHEVPLSTQVRVIEELARGDAAAAWCVMISSTTALVAGYMDDAPARQIFGDPGKRFCGVYAPKGKAHQVDGGWKVSGRWPFGSGSHHSHWRLGGTLCRTPDSDRPSMRLMVFSADQTELLDTWDTSGLRGTGSHDMQVSDVFVPAELSVALGRPQRDEPLYHIPFFAFLAVEVAAVSLGIGRASLDALHDVAAAKVPTGGRRTVAQKGGAQVAFATSTARLESARAWLLDCVGKLETALEAGTQPSTEVKAHLRLACIHAAKESADVTTEMLRLGGGSAIYGTNPLQRLFRDGNAVTAHAMVSPLMVEYIGKVLLGQTDDVSQL